MYLGKCQTFEVQFICKYIFTFQHENEIRMHATFIDLHIYSKLKHVFAIRPKMELTKFHSKSFAVLNEETKKRFVENLPK